jgi:hypothetical protein
MNNEIISLLSYPKSGSVWLWHCLQYVFQTTNSNQTPTIEALRHAAPNLEIKDNIYIHKHHVPQPSWDDKNSFLILMLRDPKEAIFSYGVAYCNNEFSFSAQAERYAKLVNYWESRKNKKALIYYEDFINSPLRTLENIIKLAAPHQARQISNLTVDLEGLKNASLELKNKTGHPALSGGDKKVFHSKNLSPQNKEELNRTLQKSLGPNFSFINHYFYNENN